MKDFAKIATPLTELTEKGRKFVWTGECQEAWDKIIRALAEKKGIYPVDYSLPLYIRTDACKYGF